MTDPILFKKYANRRLYDLSKSKYVTLDEISDLIGKGHDVQVVDAKTKKDVTAFVLTQIILEQAKNKNILLPVSFLHFIIRNGETVMPHYFESYFKQFIGGFDMFSG